MKQYTRINRAISAPKVRLIGINNTQMGIVGLEKALQHAEQASLDLVEIAPQANPPVVKIVNWGKYQYEQTKREQKSKKKQQKQALKQLRFGLKIGEHDRNIKQKKIRSFIERGHNVRLSIFFRGREIIHPELGHQLLDKIVNDLSDIAVVDQPAVLSGKYLSTVIRKK